MGRCKDCKFWTRRKFYRVEVTLLDGRKDTEYYHDEKWAQYRRPGPLTEEHSDFGQCDSEKLIYTQAGGCIEDDDVAHKDQRDALLYSDGEAYGAYLITGEDFGCVHWEPKGGEGEGRAT